MGAVQSFRLPLRPAWRREARQLRRTQSVNLLREPRAGRPSYAFQRRSHAPHIDDAVHFSIEAAVDEHGTHIAAGSVDSWTAFEAPDANRIASAMSRQRPGTISLEDLLKMTIPFSDGDRIFPSATRGSVLIIEFRRRRHNMELYYTEGTMKPIGRRKLGPAEHLQLADISWMHVFLSNADHALHRCPEYVEAPDCCNSNLSTW
ncbi:uncharacterized protein BDZ99DRAFT_470852 [Mytilinidion resinicola]|uniref:Uncharacterized protein n=1 Tax=Mytilinidion resinicola TaxID=574789 RepID=A0A6A6ZC70_9PEZI|nr:uncharacterized protein BDZ99DRAFT_470852 [Mytilinidion resinicola]KAF2817905.1 hypothetical protein BDZ99DRAFT_470852 [Mytilinidion resinicola]